MIGDGEKYVLEPEDFTDVSQASVLTSVCWDQIRYAEGVGWLTYNQCRWKQDREGEVVKGLAQRVAAVQKRDALQEMKRTAEDLAVAKAGLKDLRPSDPGYADAKRKKDDAQDASDKAESYYAHVLTYKRDSRIAAELSQAKPKVLIDVDDLDHDPFILNTPSFEIDLRTGEQRDHDYRSYCTHCTAADPGSQGRDEWNLFLEQITMGDQELKDFLQIAFGKALIGRVFSEVLIILYGKGGNGKSTLTNAIGKVLGDYSVQISPRILIADQHENKETQKDTLRGVRFALSSELEYGVLLDSAMLKQMVSTDRITANPKYKSPYSFVPSHSLYLSTNFLPTVSAQDDGTWDRIMVIPFNAVFRKSEGEHKNYAEDLASRCGPAILSWMIAGAQQYISAGYKLYPPEAVKTATEDYHSENDWLENFIRDCCDTSSKENWVMAGDLRTSYEEYCRDVGIPKVSKKVFRRSMIQKGFTYTKRNKGWRINGIRICGSDNPDADAVQADDPDDQVPAPSDADDPYTFTSFFSKGFDDDDGLPLR